MHLRQRRGGAALALLGTAAMLGAVLSAGCGSTSTTQTARVRVVNLATNAATADVLVNGGAEGGDLTIGEPTAYEYIGQGVSTFGFTTTATLPTAFVQPPSSTLQLNNGSFYTAYLIGRSDVPSVAGRPSPRFLQTVVTGDKGAAAAYTAGTAYLAPPSGQANVRILNGAPDAGPVDVLVNGKPAFTAVAYPPLPIVATGSIAGTTTAPAVTPVTPYAALPAGTLSVQINAAGTATVLVPATNVSVSAGNAYTLVVTEPTTTPTYRLQTFSDQP